MDESNVQPSQRLHCAAVGDASLDIAVEVMHSSSSSASALPRKSSGRPRRDVELFPPDRLLMTTFVLVKRGSGSSSRIRRLQKRRLPFRRCVAEF